MRLGILRTPNLAAANLAQVLLGAAWIPMWFFLNLYLQQVLGYGAFEGGAALLPMTAAIMLLMVVVAPGSIAPTRLQDADRRRHAAAGRRHGDPVARAARRHVRRRRPARVADRRRRDGARVHPLARHRDLLRPARGGRPGLGHRQHQLPGRLRARPGRHDRARQPQGADQIGDIAALTDGYSAAFLGAAGIAVAGALLAAVLLHTPKATAGASSDTPAETGEPVAA